MGSTRPSNRISSFEDPHVEIKFEKDENPESTFCWGLCCLQGCVWGFVGAINFFICLPSGALLIVYGHNKDYSVAIVVGVLLLCISSCGCPACLFLHRYMKSRRKKTKEISHVTAYDNPIATEDVAIETDVVEKC